MSRYGAIRETVHRHAVRMHDLGLVRGSAGNASARMSDDRGTIAITPTAIPWDEMTSDQIAILDLDSAETIDAPAPPSFELRMHLAIYRARHDVFGVIHTHSHCVSALSILRKPLPPIMDELAVHFGGEIDVVPYAFSGTSELADNVVSTLGRSTAVILSNHGNVCVGPDIGEALGHAIQMEAAAEIYLDALRAGEPHSLPDDALKRAREIYEQRRRESSS